MLKTGSLFIILFVPFLCPQFSFATLDECEALLLGLNPLNLPQSASASLDPANMKPFVSVVNGKLGTGLFHLGEDAVLTVSPPYFIQHSMSEGLLPIGMMVGDKTAKYTYVDDKGNPIGEFVFDEVTDFKNERAVVSQNGKWGVINTQGAWVIEPEYNWVSHFSKDAAVVCRGTKYAVVDRDGNFLTEFEFDFASEFEEGLAKVAKKDSVHDGRLLFGFITPKGKEAIPLQFEDVGPFSQSLAPAKIGGKYGFIRKDGTFAIPPRYGYVLSFREGMAAVFHGAFFPYGKWGYINMKGDEIIAAQFESAGSFSEGLAATSLKDKQSLYGYINPKGEYVIAPQFTRAERFKNGTASVEMGLKTGYIDRSGNWVQQADLEEILRGRHSSELEGPKSAIDHK